MTKTNCVLVKLGRITDKIQEDRKTHLPLKIQEQKQGTGHAPAHNITKGVGKPPKPPSGLTPEPTPTLTPHKETAHSPSLQQGPQKSLV